MISYPKNNSIITVELLVHFDQGVRIQCPNTEFVEYINNIKLIISELISTFSLSAESGEGH